MMPSSPAQAAPRIVTTRGNNFPSDIPFSSGEPPRRSAAVAEQHQEGAPFPAIAHIDWFAFTVTPPDGQGLHWLAEALRQFLPDLALIPTGKGWNGYKHRHTIMQGDNAASLGLVAHGGESQRGSVHVELTGQACALVIDWEQVEAWGKQCGATITRVDLAHDDMTGEVVSIDGGLEWLRAGDFNLNGRPAKARLIDDLGSGDGKTLYVGQRANGKMLRIYEKGKASGDSQSPWVRVEVELRNKSRLIPWDILNRPGRYLAGAYPCLAFLSAVQDKIKTISKAVQITLAAATHHLRETGGKLINVLMQQHGGDAFAVVNELKREGVPRRLASYSAFLPDVLQGATS